MAADDSPSASLESFSKSTLGTSTPQRAGCFVDVDPIQQRVGDAFLIHRPESLAGFGDGRRSAGAWFKLVAVVAAGGRDTRNCTFFHAS